MLSINLSHMCIRTRSEDHRIHVGALRWLVLGMTSQGKPGCRSVRLVM